jgi:hypothetical protein
MQNFDLGDFLQLNRCKATSRSPTLMDETGGRRASKGTLTIETARPGKIIVG